MSKPEVLLMAKMNDHVMEALHRDYVVHRYDEADDKKAFLDDVGGEIRGIATTGHLGASAEVMAALPKLEIVSSYGVGYDAVDVGYAEEHGVIVANTPNVLNDDVANLAVALLLDTSRRIRQGDAYVRQGRWAAEGDMPLARSIRGKTIGILGLGRIGKTIAEKLQVFGCEVVYHGRSEQADVAYRYYADLVEMARDSYAIICICPGGASTHHIVNQEVIEALGPEGTLINVARGAVVDEEALVAALVDGRLGCAGLDVFEDEPRVPEALFELEHIVLQPHRGSATVETRHAMGELMLENLSLHFAGKPVATPVVGG